MRARINDSFDELGLERPFTITAEERSAFQWFEYEITLTMNYDFFDKRPTSYAKPDFAFSPDQIFAA